MHKLLIGYSILNVEEGNIVERTTWVGMMGIWCNKCGRNNWIERMVIKGRRPI